MGEQPKFSGGGFLDMFKNPPDGDGGSGFSTDTLNLFNGQGGFQNPISNNDGGSMDEDDYWKTAGNGFLMFFGIPPLF